MVDLPGLVRDPQVVSLGLRDIEEHHEVRDEDLVHPAQRLEAVQLVLGEIGLHVGRLAGQLRARRVDCLALGFEDS